MYGMRGCEIKLESGENLSYMPIPDDVRFSFASIERFYIADAGQKIISDKLDEMNKAKEKFMNVN
jgi:hypothetical protein